MVVVAGGDEQRAVPLLADAESECIDVECACRGEISDLQMDVADVRVVRESLAAAGFGTERVEIERQRVHLDAALCRRPLRTRPVAIDFDAVVFRVAQVQGLADAVVGRAGELPRLLDPVQCCPEGRPVGDAEGRVKEPRFVAGARVVLGRVREFEQWGLADPQRRPVVGIRQDGESDDVGVELDESVEVAGAQGNPPDGSVGRESHRIGHTGRSSVRRISRATDCTVLRERVSDSKTQLGGPRKTAMAELNDLRVYPIKGLDGTAVDSARILPGGTVEFDREFALVDDAGEVVNGKRTDRVHDLRTDFDLQRRTVTVTPPNGGPRRFDLESERARAEVWFGDYFGLDLTLERDTDLGYVDRRGMGPSVISTATLEAVASWFEGMTVESARRRLRANVEVAGVPAFWEDRFVGDDAPAFTIGDVTFEGITPCGRCIVPARDPDSGTETPEFRERFLEKRQETFPEWADPDAFDHFFSLMILTSVPEADRGATVSVGDGVTTAGRNQSKE